MTTEQSCLDLEHQWVSLTTPTACTNAGHVWGALLTEEDCMAAGRSWIVPQTASVAGSSNGSSDVVDSGSSTTTDTPAPPDGSGPTSDTASTPDVPVVTPPCTAACTAGDERCAADLFTLEACVTDASGCLIWVPQATCITGDMCIDGTCLTPAQPTDFQAAAPWYSCPDTVPQEGTVVVTAFDAADQYFGDPNLRKIEAEVNFPEAGPWVQVGMWFQLDCPESGLCDHWDRSGSVQLVLNPDAPEGEPREELELLRHITPYRIGMCQYVDVTPLAHLLRGPQTLTSWIDTWVGPGHNQGEGWRVTAKFVFYPGAAAGADHVLNVWGRRNITVGEIEAESNVDSQITPVDVLIPETATSVFAHLTTTGHSFGNAQNCAEFCQMRHDVIVDGAIVDSINPWRSDCAQNPVSPQYGTWEYPRNGWCPGAAALGHLIDLTDVVTPGTEASIDLDILMYDGSEYDNTSPVDLLPYTYVSLKLYAYE